MQFTDAPETLTSYDLAGNIQSVTNPRGGVTTNSYDALNRMVFTTDPLNITDEYEYDATGNRTLVRDSKGNGTYFLYDDLNRLLRQTDALGRKVIFACDAVNKVSREDSLEANEDPGQGPGRVTTYEYDDLHRLTDVNYVGRSADDRTYMGCAMKA